MVGGYTHPTGLLFPSPGVPEEGEGAAQL
ncbi:MAG: hypothetical protein JWP03_5425, partial [Phycisphaerales bacterium]|nr:hypothetical protein [Phycisphaerales bacterium]